MFWLRYSDGVTPTIRRKILVKWLLINETSSRASLRHAPIRIVQKFFGAFNLAVKHKLVRCCTGALLKTFWRSDIC